MTFPSARCSVISRWKRFTPHIFVFAEKQILAGDSFEIIFPPEYTREDGTGRYLFIEGFSPSGAATVVDTLQFQSDGLTASLSSFSSSKPPGTKIVLQVSVNNPSGRRYPLPQSQPMQKHGVCADENMKMVSTLLSISTSTLSDCRFSCMDTKECGYYAFCDDLSICNSETQTVTYSSTAPTSMKMSGQASPFILTSITILGAYRW